MTTTTDTPRTDAFYPNHEAAIASPTHAAKRSNGLKALATGLWKTAWVKHPKISDEFFIAHESLEVASEQMQKLEAEVERLREWIRSEWPADQAEEIINSCKSK